MNNEFPRILSLLRKERGLTQKQVATDLDVAQALLSHYEKGKRECGLEFLVKAADYYNVSTDYLLGKEEQKEKPLVNGDEELTEYLEILKTRPEMRMLFQLSKDATKEDVEAAVRIIEALRNK